MPAPSAAPTRAGPTRGQPASAPTARPVPAPMPPPVTARSPQVSPQADTDRARGIRRTEAILVFMVRTSEGKWAGSGRTTILGHPRGRLRYLPAIDRERQENTITH